MPSSLEAKDWTDDFTRWPTDWAGGCLGPEEGGMEGREGRRAGFGMSCLLLIATTIEYLILLV